jgi:enamine deaminase RidA (YjgF/YER057c/UK114 family)
MGDVVKVNVSMTDIGEFAAVNEVYAEFFPGDLPARAVAGVASLPKGARIAMEAVADVSGTSAG